MSTMILTTKPALGASTSGHVYNPANKIGGGGI